MRLCLKDRPRSFSSGSSSPLSRSSYRSEYAVRCGCGTDLREESGCVRGFSSWSSSLRSDAGSTSSGRIAPRRGRPPQLDQPRRAGSSASASTRSPESTTWTRRWPRARRVGRCSTRHAPGSCRIRTSRLPKGFAFNRKWRPVSRASRPTAGRTRSSCGAGSGSATVSPSGLAHLHVPSIGRSRPRWTHPGFSTSVTSWAPAACSAAGPRRPPASSRAGTP